LARLERERKGHVEEITDLTDKLLQQAAAALPPSVPCLGCVASAVDVAAGKAAIANGAREAAAANGVANGAASQLEALRRIVSAEQNRANQAEVCC
jgi:hypothetical protein